MIIMCCSDLKTRNQWLIQIVSHYRCNNNTVINTVINKIKLKGYTYIDTQVAYVRYIVKNILQGTSW